MQPPPRDLGIAGPVWIMQRNRQMLPLPHKPAMPRAEVDMRDRVIRPLSNLVRLMLHRAPEVRDETIHVAHDLKRRGGRCRKQHRCGPAERFYVLLGPPEPLPHHVGDRTLAAEVGKGRDQNRIPC